MTTHLTMQEPTPHCLECGKPITRGRADKKFCDEGCRTLYHNRHKISEHQEVKRIQLGLNKNRRILKDVLAGKQEVLCPSDELKKAGFNFDFHTHHAISKVQKNEYLFCYNYGYRWIDDNTVKVVKSFDDKKTGKR